MKLALFYLMPCFGCCWPLSNTMAASRSFLTINFEVFGKVQGVFFRKCTKRRADEIGVKGWVMNTERQTVVGIIQGSPDKISVMKNWLKNEGSRKSRIDKCVFTDAQEIETFKAFDIRK